MSEEMFGKLSPLLGAEQSAELRQLSENKLYHQLIESSFKAVLILTEEKKQNNVAMELFKVLVKPIAEKLNPVRFTELSGLVLRKAMVGSSESDKLSFLAENFKPFDATNYLDDKASGSTGESGTKDAKGTMSHYAKAAFSDFLDAKALFLAFKVSVLIEFKNLEKAKDCMDDLTQEIYQGKRPLVQITSKVFSWYHCAQMVLFEASSNASGFFRAGINYFRYTPIEVAKRDWNSLNDVCVKLGLACLTSPGDYCMGELLELEVFKALSVGECQWIYNLVYAFQEGSYELYDSAKSRFSREIGQANTNFPEFSLEKHSEVVYEKFCACVLIEYAFRQPKSNRKLRLEKLRQIIRVKDVETLLINSMCAGLVRGIIDQVEGTFFFEWVRPRTLDIPRLEVLESRLGDWITHQKAVLARIEEMTPELLVTV